MCRILLAIVAALPLSFAGAAAQDFPSRPATWIVPYPPGGGADTISRLITTEIAKRLGQPVINESKPGASTQIGLKAVSEARPDGHTVGMMTADINVTSALLPSAPFDLEKDFAYITQIINVPMVMVANSKAPFTNLKELVAYAKATPDKITAASIGATSIHHVGMEWFKKLAGLEFLGGPVSRHRPRPASLLANEVQLMFMGVGVGTNSSPTVPCATLLSAAPAGSRRRRTCRPSSRRAIRRSISSPGTAWWRRRGHPRRRSHAGTRDPFRTRRSRNPPSRRSDRRCSPG